MRIRLGEHVLTSDGEDAGTVHKVILDPNGGEVTTVVLRRGALITHDVEVPLARLGLTDDGNLRLDVTAVDLDDLPPFEEASYRTVPVGTVLPPEYPYEYALWPIAAAPIAMGNETFPGENREVRAEIANAMLAADLNNAVVGKGSGVYGSDGEKVGEVERLTFNEAGALVELIVHQGLLFPKEFALPGSLVGSADDGKLYLTVDRSRVDEIIAA